MRRVVVTGLGAVTPVGNDVDTFWNNLTNGVSGIGEITKFDTTDYKVKIAAEVKEFDPLLYMEKSEVRKEDLFSQYAVAAAVQAMNDSGLNAVEGDREVNIDPERLGVYIGSGTGGMNTFLTEMWQSDTMRRDLPFRWSLPVQLPPMPSGKPSGPSSMAMRMPSLPVERRRRWSLWPWPGLPTAWL